MDIQFSQYIKAFIRYWWLIVAIMLLSIGIGLAYSNSQTPIYEAQIAIVASPNLAISDTGDLINGLNAVARNTELTTTACGILESSSIRESVAQQLDIPLSLAIEYEVTCVVLPDSTILNVNVRGESPELAADLANGLGETGTVYVSELYEVIKLSLLDLAVVNLEPVSPDHFINAVLSAFIGFVAAVGFIALRETLIQVFGDSASDASEDDESITEADSADINQTSQEQPVQSIVSELPEA
jgi:capsular polysaccharide biosynthesis protein